MIIGILLTAIIVPVLLNAMSGKTKTTSINKFDMRLPKNEFLILGVLGCCFFGFCLYGTIYSGQTKVGTLSIFGSLFALSFLLMIAPVKGFWENSVNEDSVTSIRLWIFRKSLKISEIDHCVMKRGGISVYAKGHTRPSLRIDSMAENIPNFIKRMEKEKISVEVKDTLNPQMLDTNSISNTDEMKANSDAKSSQSTDNNNN